VHFVFTQRSPWFLNNGHDASGVHCGIDQNGLYTHNKLEEINRIDFTAVIKIDKEL